MTLYHYTCQHGRDRIGDRGVLAPARHLSENVTAWQGRFVWLTDLSVPIRDALGLTQQIAKCDRTAYRYRVTDETSVWPWVQIAHLMKREQREEIEGAPGARPSHWYVSFELVPVVLEEIP